MTTNNWRKFKKTYPQAFLPQFEAYPRGVNYIPTPNGISHDVFIDEVGGRRRHYYGEIEKGLVTALGPRFVEPKTIHKETVHKEAVHVEQHGNFPSEIIYNKEVKYPISDYKSEPTDISELLTNLTIFVSENQSFEIKVKDIYNESTRHKSLKEVRKWLKEPSLDYWTQQLNFAVWAASTGCGIGADMLINTKWDPMIISFLRFHVAFTVRRILYELGAPLPNDEIWSLTGNRWGKDSWEKLRNEFRLSDPDFRVHETISFYDLEKISIHQTGYGIWQKENSGYLKTPFKFVNGFKESLVAWVDRDIKYPFNYFITREGKGLTMAGLSRLNRSIEAYVYCILGSQVNTRSSIIGNSGSSEETHQEFLVLFESSIIENDITKSIQRYQLSIQEAKVKLDLAISPECWLLPSNMVLNRESVTGYNNKLQKASKDMRFGVNDINNETKNVGVITMEGHKPKTVLPHIEKHQPEVNPIIDKHKKVIPKKPIIGNDYKNDTENENHKKLKIGLLASAVGLGYYFFR